MKSYLVGGAVRDALLDCRSKTETAVVGATPQQMLDAAISR